MYLCAKHKNMSFWIGLLEKHCEEEEAEYKAHPVIHGHELLCAVMYLCDHSGCNLFHWDRLVCLKVVWMAELYLYVEDVVNMCSEWLHPCKHWKSDSDDNVHTAYRAQGWGLHSSAAEELGVDRICVHRVSASRYLTLQTVTVPSSSGSRSLDIFLQNIGNHCPSDTMTHAGKSEFYIITWS